MLKRLVSALLCAVLFAAAAPGAWATEECELGTTERFVEALEEENLFYAYCGVDGMYEIVKIGFDTDKIKDLEMTWFFNTNEKNVIIIWQPFEYDESLYDELLEELNELNKDYSFIKWSAGDDSARIRIEMDLIIRDNENLGEICLGAMARYLDIMNETYERLLPYEA